MRWGENFLALSYLVSYSHSHSQEAVERKVFLASVLKDTSLAQIVQASSYQTHIDTINSVYNII